MSLLRNTVLASIGMLHVTRAKAEKIIDDLIKRGEVDRSERKKAIMELVSKADKSTAEWRKKAMAEAEKASKGVSRLAKDLSWARNSDLKKLETKINKLTKELKALKASMAR